MRSGLHLQSPSSWTIATYARSFVGLPILVAAEVVIGPRLRAAGLHFVREDFHSTRRHSCLRAGDHAARARGAIPWRQPSSSSGLAVFGAWKLTLGPAGGVSMTGWRSIVLPHGHALHLFPRRALWNNLVAAPIVLFLLLPLAVANPAFWTIFLRDVARHGSAARSRLTLTRPAAWGFLGAGARVVRQPRVRGEHRGQRPSGVSRKLRRRSRHLVSASALHRDRWARRSSFSARCWSSVPALVRSRRAALASVQRAGGPIQSRVRREVGMGGPEPGGSAAVGQLGHSILGGHGQQLSLRRTRWGSRR